MLYAARHGVVESFALMASPGEIPHYDNSMFVTYKLKNQILIEKIQV